MVGCAEEVGEDEHMEDEHLFLLFECEEQRIIDQTFSRTNLLLTSKLLFGP